MYFGFISMFIIFFLLRHESTLCEVLLCIPESILVLCWIIIGSCGPVFPLLLY